MADSANTRSGLDENGLSLSYTGAVATWQQDNPGEDLAAQAAAQGVSVEQYLVNTAYLSPYFQGAASQSGTVGPGGNPSEGANVVPITNPYTVAYDDNGNAASGDTSTNTESAGGSGGSGKAKYDIEKASDPTFYLSVEDNRAAMSPPAREKDPAPAPAASGDAPTYDDNGMATDSGSSGGGSRRRSSGGSSGSGGGGGASTSAPAAPAFPGGGFGTPNAYPTLPMTPIRAKILGNLSGTFPNAGRFPTPPGGWREDMAPMFTTGAFGGVSAPAPESAPAAAPAAPQMPSGGFSMPSMPAMGGGIPGGPASAPPLPDPTAAPPEAMLGLTPPQGMQGGMPPMGGMAPQFSQPGFVAPGSPYDMQMQRMRPTGSGNAAPLPASLRQRFGL